DGTHLYVGTNNPANKFFLAETADGIQVGLDVRYYKDNLEVVPIEGKNTFLIEPNRVADARFAYTVANTASDGEVTLDLDKFSYRLKIDTDGSDKENFLIFDLVEQDTPKKDQVPGDVHK